MGHAPGCQRRTRPRLNTGNKLSKPALYDTKRIQKMPEQIKIAEDVREEAEKTVKSLKSIGLGEGKKWPEIKEKYLD